MFKIFSRSEMENNDNDDAIYIQLGGNLKISCITRSDVSRSDKLSS